MRLRPVLEGHTLDRFWARKLRGHRPRVGQMIEAVRAEGKHLLVELDRDLTLDVHLGMSGSWRAFPRGTDPQRALRSPKLRVHLGTTAGDALCFAAPTVQTFLRSAEITPLTGLGPDLTVAELDAADLAGIVAAARARHGPRIEIHDVLLDQSVASGIGNVFKSEVLFHVGLWPFTALEELTDAELVALYQRAAALLRSNVRSGSQMRSTTPHGGSFVYERWRKPCLECTTPIRRAYRGRTRRSTYWCPTCQPAEGLD